MALLLLMVAAMAAAVGVAAARYWAAVDERSSAEHALDARQARMHEFWQSHVDLVGMEIDLLDLREAGWSEERGREFLEQHFAGRKTLILGDLRPFLDDVTVQDVFRYRRLRRQAAARFEAIRHTWVNVEDEERAGHLPDALAPFITTQERQSGRLVRAGDLLPFVGRPLIWSLLENKRTDCGL